jgi:hypothetical protein
MPVEIIIDPAELKITIRGDGEELFKLAEAFQKIAPAIEHVEVLKGFATKDKPSDKNAKHANGPLGEGMKAFCKKLGLESNVMKITAIAYYMKHADKKDTFSSKDMKEAYDKCVFTKPTQMAVAFSDTKKSKDSIEKKGHDQWAITNVGENLIVALINAIDEK